MFILIYTNDIIYITFYIHYFKKLERTTFSYYTTIKIMYLNNNNYNHNFFNDKLYYKSLKYNIYFLKILSYFFSISIDIVILHLEIQRRGL
jgi:hypothetical protein